MIRVRVNPKFYRPTEVEQLLGDPRKANEKLGWKPKVMIDTYYFLLNPLIYFNFQLLNFNEHLCIPIN